MFPLIPALILLLLHGPSSFERLAETGRLPAALAVLHRQAISETAHSDLDKEDVSRRVLASFIAASGVRELSEAFASMFLARDSRSNERVAVLPGELEDSARVVEQPSARLHSGFLRAVRSRDGPLSV